MSKAINITGIVVAVSLFLLPLSMHSADAKKALTDKELIASAMAAAPAKVAKHATIVVM